MVAPELEDFDLFCFEDSGSMDGILLSPLVTVTDAGSQVVTDYPNPPGTSNDLGVLSGKIADGAFSQANAVIAIEPAAGIGQTWTVEWQITFEALPSDFGSLTNHHVFIGASDASGPIAGLFISLDGVQYVGAVHHAAGNLVVDTPITPIPATSQYIELGEPTVFRLAVDGANGVVYLYITKASLLPTTGQHLVAILPVIDASTATFPPTDRSLISVRGSTADPSRIAVDHWCGAAAVLVANLPPVALTGEDQAVTFCSIARFDGTSSFDPEGAELTYSWKLVGAPDNSAFTVSGNDGRTYPLFVPTGFTDRFHSVSLSLIHADDPLQAGDILFVDTITYVVVSTGTDGDGFYVLVSEEAIPDGLSPRPYRVYRQRGVSGPTEAKPTFLADITGFYRFELIVSDGLIDSQPAVVVLNVVDSPLPRGIIPDASFVFDYLSDYWDLLEDPGPIATFWSGLAQVAASELYTLWQHDYSKSLRDIQRTFLRRWLHYDLLLAEPVPELTSLRVFYGGRTTTLMAAAGVGGMSGTSFRISSGVHDTRTITLVTANPVTATQLAAELRNRLLEVDPRYTTEVLTLTSTDQIVRINAPFVFNITNSTVPVLGSGSTLLAQGPGEVMGPRTYRTDVGLTGLGLQEDDLLILGDNAYRVSQIVDDPSDDYRFQRVVLKSDIQLGDTNAWILTGYVTSELLDFYQGLISSGDRVFFEIVALTDADETSLLETTALGVAADTGSNLAFGIDSDLSIAIASPDRFTVRLAKVVRRTYLPVDSSIVDIPTLTELIEIVDDEATLRRNLDFFIEDYRGQHCIRFVSGQFSGPDVWEGETPPDRLWAEYTYLDNNPTIEANFGILAEVSIDEIAALPGDVDYLSAVRGIWYAYVNGPTLFNLRVGAQILLGLPFAEEAGVIEEIRTDFSPTRGRILVRDADRTEIVRSYTFPRSLALEVNPVTEEVYAVGDVVSQFAPLVEGVEIIDYVKDPTWFVGLLNQGIFYEPEKYFQFLVRVDSAAFGLESLQFVQNFILKIKPTYTYPFFLIETDLGEGTEVSVTDELEVDVTLEILDNVCAELGAFSTSFDDARASGGGFWNQFDTDSDDGTPLPTFPTSDVVEWAFDRYVLCPEDNLQTHCCQVFAAPALASTGVNLDTAQHLFNDARFKEAGPFVVANGATGEAITADVGTTVPKNGTVVGLRLLIVGGPGTDPATYELVYAVNGVDQAPFAFTSVATFTHVRFTTTKAVVATDVLTARIRHAGGSPRSPAWTSVRIDISIDLGTFAGGDLLPVGNYCASRSIV